MGIVGVSRASKREPGRFRRQWRFYRSAAGRQPVRDFLDQITDEDAAAIASVMKQVREIGRGHIDVNHLHGDIWQVEIDGNGVIYRLLFAEEGRFSQVLLALEIVNKKWQSAKTRHIALAERRLKDWRSRGRSGPRVALRRQARSK